MSNNTAADSNGPHVNSSRPITPSRFLTYSGRITRLEFFWTHLFCIVVAVAGLSMVNPTNVGLSFLALSPVLFAIYLCIVAGIKRCHDLGKSGWLYVLTMGVPVINFGTGLYLLFAKGMDTPNEYGLATNTKTPTSSEISLGSNGKVPAAHGKDSILKNTEDIHLHQKPSEAIPEGFDEKNAYSLIANELESKTADPGLWLKAMVESGQGDERQQTVVYTRLRINELRETFLAKQAHAEAPESEASPFQAPPQMLDAPGQEPTRPAIVEGVSDSSELSKARKKFLLTGVAIASIFFIFIGFFSSTPVTRPDLATATAIESQPKQTDLLSQAPEPPALSSASRREGPLEQPGTPAEPATKLTVNYDELLDGILGPVGGLWAECHSELKSKYTQSCPSGAPPSCSQPEFRPKISELSARKTSYGTNYVLLVRKLSSYEPAKTFRTRYSCEISNAGEVISLTEIK